jgi:4-amino-4-deoxy-L-arabinose transferase-like glycosyltransferase
LILSCTFLFTYLNARFITRNHAAGAAAALALFFAPQLAWESQRDLSHTVLASALAAATLFCLFHLLARPRILKYVLFGLCCGLGFLSKYNFSLWILGLLIAACSMREFRPVLRNPRILVSVLVCVLIVLPNALWIANHPDKAFRTMTKLALNEDAPWLTTTYLCLKILS